MTDYIWKKAGQRGGPDAAVMDYLAGRDVMLDRELIEFDIEASQAHAEGLAQIGIISAEEASQLVSALADIARRLDSGSLSLDAPFEDGHSALEAWLTEELGSLGGKIHTGRSRNDQVAVAMRLYLRNRLKRLTAACIEIAEVLIRRAGKEGALPMPGHTHLQRAMPSSTGLWSAGHAEAFVDNAELARATTQWLNASPLGTASGFGVNLPLPRAETAERLSFERIVVNPQYAQNSRGKVEIQALSALAAATRDLRRLAWDLSLYCSQEFGFVTLPDAWCTGSSLMPNKRNPDVVEVLRAQHATVVAAQVELESVMSLPSGYQRDLQATKAPVLRAFASSLQALELVPALLAAMQWNPNVMRDAITPEMLTTDRVTALSAEGIPFREAYRNVLQTEGGAEDESVEACLAKRCSPGASGALCLDVIAARIETLKAN